MDMKQDISAKECVNCPGATDHDTAHCPIKPQASAAQSAPDAHERWLSDPNNEPFPGGLSGIPMPALQSAPDEREAFEAAIRHSYPRNHYLYLTRKADGYENPYISIRWDGFQAGAAWQRAQSAPDDLAAAVRVLLEVPQLQGDQAYSAQPIIDLVRTQLAAWQRAQSAPVVPEGWRLVPEELTLEMQAAAKGISRWQHEDMLAAASKVAPHG